MLKYRNIRYLKNSNEWLVTITTNNVTISKRFTDLNLAKEYRNRLKLLISSNKTIFDDTEIDTSIPNFHIAFNEFIKYKAKFVKHSTIQAYYYTLNMFSLYVGYQKIDKIFNWNELCNSIYEKNNLAYITITKAIRHIKAMYEYFINKGTITENPALKIKLIPKRKIKQKRNAISEKEQTAFFRACQLYFPEYYNIFLMYFQTGCRRGELLCLTYDDIDTENKCIRITKTLSRGIIDGKYCEIVETPKTAESIREIAISDKMVFMLMMQMKMRKANSSDLVFPSVVNKRKPFAVDAISKIFKKICKKAGLSDTLTLHSTRHTFASKLIMNGVDYATVAELGGWSNPNVLLSTYAHSNTEHKRNVLNNFIF